MGKRSNFKRIKGDFYKTPYEAVIPLLPYINNERFCEPCAGDGRLIRHLERHGHKCAAAWDIKPRAKGITRKDASKREIGNITCFITNPPWSRDLLHPIIENLSSQHPTLLV